MPRFHAEILSIRRCSHLDKKCSMRLDLNSLGTHLLRNISAACRRFEIACWSFRQLIGELFSTLARVAVLQRLRTCIFELYRPPFRFFAASVEASESKQITIALEPSLSSQSTRPTLRFFPSNQRKKAALGWQLKGLRVQSPSNVLGCLIRRVFFSLANRLRFNLKAVKR